MFWLSEVPLVDIAQIFAVVSLNCLPRSQAMCDVTNSRMEVIAADFEAKQPIDFNFRTLMVSRTHVNGWKRKIIHSSFFARRGDCRCILASASLTIQRLYRITLMVIVRRIITIESRLSLAHGLGLGETSTLDDPRWVKRSEKCRDRVRLEAPKRFAGTQTPQLFEDKWILTAAPCRHRQRCHVE